MMISRKLSRMMKLTFWRVKVAVIVLVMVMISKNLSSANQMTVILRRTMGTKVKGRKVRKRKEIR